MDSLILPPEIEEGNIEYKRQVDDQVINIPDKMIKFKTQLIWRLSEGQSKAIYYIGIEDNGQLSGLTIDVLQNSINNFTKIIKSINASIVSTQIEYIGKSVYAKIIVHKLDNYHISTELNIGLLGGSNNGKSSFLGMITFDIKDDGNGLARANILTHDHEKQSGMTSSIKYEIIGYSDDKYINYNSNFVYSWEYIIKRSKVIINLIDLPGNYKYIKTTLFGLMAHRPNHALIFSSLVDNTIENINTTNLHIELCKRLDIPYTIIKTKKDLCPEYKEEDNTISLSNITGEGIEDIKNLLKNIKVQKHPLNINTKTTEFMINDIIIVPDIGTVITGVLNQGKIKIGDILSVGPHNNTFYNVEIISIHKKQIPSKYLYCGEIGSLVIHSHYCEITKHMMIITPDQIKNFKKEFSFTMDSNQDISINFKYMAFCRNIYDSVDIIDVQENVVFAKFSKIQYIKTGEYVILKKNDNMIFGKILK
jgi:GTPase